MYPFKQAFAEDLSGVMIAHMNIPALDPTPNLPSTLSKPIVTSILKEKLGFKGLVFSDAMGMKGVVKYFPNNEADVRGVIAGMDVIELSPNTDKAIKLIRKSIRQKRLTWFDIDNKVKRILAAKYWMGLNKVASVKTENLVSDLNRPESYQLIQQLTDAAITVVKGAEQLPLRNDFVSKTAILSVGENMPTVFSDMIKKSNAKNQLFIIPKDISVKEMVAVKTELQNFDQVVLAIYDTRKRPISELDYPIDLKLFIADIARKNTISVVFANPYTVAGLPGLENSKSVLIGYQNSKEMEKSAAKVILGLLKATGKLPVTINSFFKYGDGAQMN